MKSPLIVGLLTAALAAEARADVVYSQPSDFDAGLEISAWASEVSATGAFSPTQTFDSFTLDGSADVDSLSWQGTYISLVNEFPPAVASAFNVNLYLDAGGTPGALVSGGSFDVGAGTDFVQETLNASVPDFPVLGPLIWLRIYDYQLDQSTPVSLALAMESIEKVMVDFNMLAVKLSVNQRERFVFAVTSGSASATRPLAMAMSA